jgi:5'-nucleotidase / UDP-sugar diphosphatase
LGIRSEAHMTKLFISYRREDSEGLTGRISDRLVAHLARKRSSSTLAPPNTVDKASVHTETQKGVIREIKEWQAIMDYLRALPVKTPGDLPIIAVDGRAKKEVRAIKAG